MYSVQGALPWFFDVLGAGIEISLWVGTCSQNGPRDGGTGRDVNFILSLSALSCRHIPRRSELCVCSNA